MGQETERRFLVRSHEWRELAGAGVDYRQGYLTTDSKRNVRIRLGNKEARITIKGQANGNTRPEFEYPIPLRDGKDLEQLCLKPILEKTRYTLKQDGLTWEIDEYRGDNTGLIVAEVETVAEGPIDNLPPWIGPDISGDDRYRNINLVEHPFTTWSQDPQKPDIRYFLTSHEELPDGLHRILNEQLSAAIDELSNEKGSLDNAVHEARKCVKRTRSVLRLIRPAIPKICSRENSRLQGVGRKLSELRDAQALIETLQTFHDRRANGDLTDVDDYLRTRKEAIIGAVQSRGELRTVVEELEQARRSIRELSLDIDFRIIADSLKTSMKRGKKAFSKAYADPRPETFHELRKRVKDLRYQLSLLAAMWPDVLEAYANSAKKLEEFLGDDHNLAVLDDVLNQANRGKKGLRSEIAKKQAAIRENARLLGSRLFSEPAGTFTRRLRSSWKAWQAETS